MANNKIPRELVEKAMQCETAEELLKLAEENGIELTMEEAEAYLAEGAVANLDEEAMARVAGGIHMQPHRCPYRRL